jgi:putative ABC transport system ATP-binding protein
MLGTKDGDESDVATSAHATAAGIELRHVAVRYETLGLAVSVVEDISCAVRSGRITALVGRSGSGKTSLLRVAAGLQQSSQGDVLWDGRPLLEWSRAEIQHYRQTRLGVAFQDSGLIEILTATENVLIAAASRREARLGEPRAASLLADLGLQGRESHRPAQLSGGEQQRVGLARALFNAPTFLLLDEPTASLDRDSAGVVTKLLAALRTEGCGILVATHDPNVVALADDLIVTDGDV